MRWRDGYGWFNGRVLNAKRVETRVVERGPVRVEIEVGYSYNRPSRTFNEARSCATLGMGSAPCVIPRRVRRRMRRVRRRMRRHYHNTKETLPGNTRA